MAKQTIKKTKTRYRKSKTTGRGKQRRCRTCGRFI